MSEWHASRCRPSVVSDRNGRMWCWQEPGEGGQHATQQSDLPGKPPRSQSSSPGSGGGHPVDGGAPSPAGQASGDGLEGLAHQAALLRESASQRALVPPQLR